MLYETLNQPLILLWLLIFGFASGFIVDFANFFIKLCKNKAIFRHIFNFLAGILISFVFFLLIFNLNFGELRFYQLCVFAISLIFQRILMQKVVAKWLKLCYTSIVDKLKKFKNEKK